MSRERSRENRWQRNWQWVVPIGCLGAISLAGPNGEAKLFAVATKAAGEWTFERLEVVPENGRKRIDLLAEGRRRCELAD